MVDAIEISLFNQFCPHRLKPDTRTGTMGNLIYSCLKCGSWKTNKTYHSGSYGWRGNVCGSYTNNTRTDEHLHIYCETCKYDWTIDVLNTDKKSFSYFGFEIIPGLR